MWLLRGFEFLRRRRGGARRHQRVVEKRSLHQNTLNS
jgi:hypothetical protein